MPKSLTSINSELYTFLKSKKYDPISVKDGKQSVFPEEATGFNFSFKADDKDFGTMHVAIDSLKKLILFYSKDSMKKINAEWTEFLKELKKWAMKKSLGFDLEPIDNLNDYMRKQAYSKKLSEGYYGTKTLSFSDKTPESVKLIIVHNKKLDENDKRFRYIKQIYAENLNKEKFLLPTKKPSEAHAFARLIHNGGNPYDERGKHISQLCDDVKKLSSFIRVSRNKNFNEDVNNIIENAQKTYKELKSTIRKISSRRGFNEYFDNWKPSISEISDNNLSKYNNLFTVQHLDERIQNAFEVLNKYNIFSNITEESQEFERWANNLIDESLHPVLRGQIKDFVELLSKPDDELSLGPDAENIIGQIEDIIQDDDLYERLKEAADIDPNTSAKNIIIGWLQENADDSHFQEILSQLEKNPQPKNNVVNVDNSQDTDVEPKKPVKIVKPAPNSNDVNNLAATLKEHDLILDYLKLSGVKK